MVIEAERKSDAVNLLNMLRNAVSSSGQSRDGGALEPEVTLRCDQS
jgi:hypothetical protein